MTEMAIPSPLQIRPHELADVTGPMGVTEHPGDVIADDIRFATLILDKRTRLVKPPDLVPTSVETPLVYQNEPSLPDVDSWYSAPLLC